MSKRCDKEAIFPHFYSPETLAKSYISLIAKKWEYILLHGDALFAHDFFTLHHHSFFSLTPWAHINDLNRSSFFKTIKHKLF